MTLTTDNFKFELLKRFREAEAMAMPFIDVRAGDMHRDMGDYPDPALHRMPSCCEVMYAEQSEGDSILSRPANGKGASLTIRYLLPRSR